MKGLFENHVSRETTEYNFSPMKFTLLTLTWNRSQFVASAHSAAVILFWQGGNKRQGNRNMICWLSNLVILEDSIPQGVPLSSESHFQPGLCVILQPSGLQHKPTPVGIVGTEKEDVLFSHLFWLNNAQPNHPHVTNTSGMHFTHLLLQAAGNVICSLCTSCVCKARNTSFISVVLFTLF